MNKVKADIFERAVVFLSLFYLNVLDVSVPPAAFMSSTETN